MIQDELKILIQKLICCSSYIANNMAIKLTNGDKGYNTNKLTILNNSINYLLKYNIGGTNCITEDDFNTIITNVKNICDICDCE